MDVPLNKLRLGARGAFTLVEILIVVVILAVLSALVMPGFVGAMEQTTQGAFIADIKTYANGAVAFWAKEGTYLEDSDSGVLPTGFGEYVDPRGWERGTPIGGVWDAELYEWGVTSAVGVHFDGTGETRDDAYMLAIDAVMDNNDLETGVFRKLGEGRYYYIVEE